MLTECVFVTQMSSIAGVSVRGIVWLMTNCRFLSNVFRPSPNIKLIKTRMMELGVCSMHGRHEKYILSSRERSTTTTTTATERPEFRVQLRYLVKTVVSPWVPYGAKNFCNS